ncbi:MAG: hypothetical protein ABL959_12370 [Pyrinomonadaceae bacterium]
MTEQDSQTPGVLTHPVVRIVAIVGDVASITGISLLWWRGSVSSIGLVEVSVVLAAVIFGFGFLMLVVAVAYTLFNSLRNEPWFNILWRLVYFTLGIPMMMLVIGGFGFLVTRQTMASIEAAMTGVPVSEVLRNKYGVQPTPEPLK